MWNIINWLFWGNPGEKENLNKDPVIDRTVAVRKIEKVYLNYKKRESKKEAVINNLRLAKVNFNEEPALKSPLNSQLPPKKRRNRNRRVKRKIIRNFQQKLL